MNTSNQNPILRNRKSLPAVINEYGRFERADAMAISVACSDEYPLTTLYLVTGSEPLAEYLGRADLYVSDGQGKKRRDALLYTAERIIEAHQKHEALMADVGDIE